MNFRKIKKLLRNPSLFLRDALINKYPIIMNQSGIKYQTEKILIDSECSLISNFIPSFEIDIVYTWVDSKDSTWQSSRQLHTSNIVSCEPFSADEARFENHDEIFYSLLSIQKYLTWVNKIFIVTDNQIPLIPDSLKDKVSIIDHKQIIPLQFLPTFNSHVIEAFLHMIPALSENFIYFNDDFFVSRPIFPSHFFKSNGISSLFISNKSIESMNKNMISTATLTASNNCNKIFTREYNIYFDRALTHTYVPLKKSMYHKAFEQYGADILMFLGNKLRGENDLNMATFFVPYLQYIDSQSVPVLDISYYFNIRSPVADSVYQNLISVKDSDNAPHSFCANDFRANEFKGNIFFREKLVKFLKKYYL